MNHLYKKVLASIQSATNVSNLEITTKDFTAAVTRTQSPYNNRHGISFHNPITTVPRGALLINNAMYSFMLWYGSGEDILMQVGCETMQIPYLLVEGLAERICSDFGIPMGSMIVESNFYQITIVRHPIIAWNMKDLNSQGRPRPVLDDKTPCVLYRKGMYGDDNVIEDGFFDCKYSETLVYEPGRFFDTQMRVVTPRNFYRHTQGKFIYTHENEEYLNALIERDAYIKRNTPEPIEEIFD